MQIPAARTKAAVAAVALAVTLAPFLPAQEAANPSPSPAAETGSAPTPNAPSKSPDSSGAAGNSSAMEYLFNRKPQEGSAAKEVMQANQAVKSKILAREALGGRIEDPQMRARFDKYLGLAEVSAEQMAAYDADMKKALELLRENRTTEAWRQLYKMADYQQIDAGVSWELANRIESIWNADKTNNKLDKTNDKLRQDVEIANRNADMLSESVQARDARNQVNSNQGNKRQSSTASEGGTAPDQERSSPPPSSSVSSVFGYLKTLESTRHYDIIKQTSQTFIASYDTCLYVLALHVAVSLFAAWWFVGNRRLS